MNIHRNEQIKEKDTLTDKYKLLNLADVTTGNFILNDPF